MGLLGSISKKSALDEVLESINQSIQRHAGKPDAVNALTELRQEVTELREAAADGW